MAFHQPPPKLGNQYDDDRVLRSYLKRRLPTEMLNAIEPSLRAMGERAGGELYKLQLEDRLNDPTLTQWDAWGHRIDAIEVSPLWKRAAVIAAEEGLVAVPYEHAHGALSRVHQMALVYLFHPSTDVYTCPLAMTDGAARTLITHDNQSLIEQAVSKLTSRDPSVASTAGQWMTERTGGSDVGISETVAREANGQWRLWGTKWFTSATTSQYALTLARPEGNPNGGRGLALFFVELRHPDGTLRNIQVNRLKDKLGTRKVPTAELTLDGTPATPVIGLTDGVRNITPVLNITRTWNAVCASATMRRGLALARDFAAHRVAFGAPLSQKPLHIDTLAGLQAETEAAFHFTFFAVELLGRDENREATERDKSLLRVITPLVKLTTGKQAVRVVSEVIECFGGAGYIEDTGLPMLLRDAHVLSIWEGTTNVLALDVMKSLDRSGDSLRETVTSLVESVREPRLHTVALEASRATDRALGLARERLSASTDRARAMATIEAEARDIALTLGRSLALALLCHHAQWSLETEKDRRAMAAAVRFARNGVDCLGSMVSLEESLALANDTALTE